MIFSYTKIIYNVGIKLFWQQAVEVSNIIIPPPPLEIRYFETLPFSEQTADALCLVISLIFILTNIL